MTTEPGAESVGDVRALVETLRDLGPRREADANSYLETHGDAWKQLAAYAPEDAADVLEALAPATGALLLARIDPGSAGRVLSEMRPNAAAAVGELLPPDELTPLIAAMEADQATDLLATLDIDRLRSVIAALDPDAAVAIERLLDYEPDTAGGMMTTNCATLSISITAGAAVDAVRALHDRLGSNLNYVYVIDSADRLCGVVSFRELVFARPGEQLEEVMVGDPVSVVPTTDSETVSELIERYRLLSIPVVDAGGRLLGMVKVDEAFAAIRAQAGEDIAVMVGAHRDESVYTPVGLSVRRRLPWIVFNLAVGLVIASVIAQFESVIIGAAILAAYMPLVALLGGNSGAQSLAVVIRSIAVGELPPGRARRAIRREFSVAVIDGLVVAVVAAAIGAATVGLFGSESAITAAQIAAILFLAIVIVFTVAGLAGGSIPLLLRAVGQDPALASNIFLTTITDTVSFGGFLLIASLLLK